MVAERVALRWFTFDLHAGHRGLQLQRESAARSRSIQVDARRAAAPRPNGR